MCEDAYNTPIHGSRDTVQGWLEKQGACALQPRFCSVFSERSFDTGVGELQEYFRSGANISWIAGPGISGIQWPKNVDGQDLAHVASLCLSDAIPHADTLTSWGPWLDLPSGYLEIYHDLETYGSQAADVQRNAWLIRYVSQTDGLNLVYPQSPPECVDGDECQLGLFMPGFSLPYFSDTVASKNIGFEAWENVVSLLQNAWHIQRFRQSCDYSIPFTNLVGYSWDGKSAICDVLNLALPLKVSDEHILLAVIESWTVLNGWFGDAGNLEVWMRRSDIEARDFTQAWCTIRIG